MKNPLIAGAATATPEEAKSPLFNAFIYIDTGIKGGIHTADRKQVNTEPLTYEMAMDLAMKEFRAAKAAGCFAEPVGGYPRCGNRSARK
jgi:hypothetical protein